MGLRSNYPAHLMGGEDYGGGPLLRPDKAVKIPDQISRTTPITGRERVTEQQRERIERKAAKQGYDKNKNVHRQPTKPKNDFDYRFGREREQGSEEGLIAEVRALKRSVERGVHRDAEIVEELIRGIKGRNIKVMSDKDWEIKFKPVSPDDHKTWILELVDKNKAEGVKKKVV